MTNKKGSYIIIAILVLIVIAGGIFVLSNKSAEEGVQAPVTETGMVDCGLAKDPMCFVNRMNGCLPVTVKMMGSDNTTKIELTVLGVEDEKCHFQRKINDVIDLNCFFPKGTMNGDVLDQTFGNDKGLQKVVDDNCKSGW
jgi:hypothetical protein